jgi:hypothetical protein
VRFQETHQRGESTTLSRPSNLLLHADAGSGRVFVGAQVVITVSEKEATTMIFKNAGVTAEVSVATLADGRYRVDARYEESQRRRLESERANATVTGSNPILQVLKSESSVTLREGETVPFASAVDPVTGEVVRVDLTVAAAPVPKAAAAKSSDEARLRARLVLARRQGETTLARRPYSVVLQAGGAEDAAVFSGSMLPVQTRMNNQVTVALKDVGAGLRIKARRTGDGRYRLDVAFNDGVLSPGEGAPELRVFQSESQIFVQEGETVTLASAVDPQTGEVVEAELTLEGLR